MMCIMDASWHRVTVRKSMIWGRINDLVAGSACSRGKIDSLPGADDFGFNSAITTETRNLTDQIGDPEDLLGDLTKTIVPCS